MKLALNIFDNMRIFFASDSTPNAAFESNLWYVNLLLPLLDLGHEVIEFKYDYGRTFLNLNPEDKQQKRFILENRPRLSAELLAQITEAHHTSPIHLFFSYFYDACVSVQTIEAIKKLGIKTINWYCNASYQLNLVSQISPHYDWCLVPEKFRLDNYRQLGANPIYCQEAANPNVYKPYNLEKEYNVTFVGQAYGDRPHFIQKIWESGIDIKVWGQGWQNYSSDRVLQYNFPTNISKIFFLSECRRLVKYIVSGLGQKKTKKHQSNSVVLPVEVLGGVLSDAEMIKMFSKSKINLGFSTCGNTNVSKERILQIRLRDFEVPMSGGFYMVEYMEELENFFKIDKEIVCYQGFEELIDKIRYYLSHDSEREAIRLNGYERCTRDHSWQSRFKMVFKEIGMEQ